MWLWHVCEVLKCGTHRLRRTCRSCTISRGIEGSLRGKLSQYMKSASVLNEVASPSTKILPDSKPSKHPHTYPTHTSFYHGRKTLSCRLRHRSLALFTPECLTKRQTGLVKNSWQMMVEYKVADSDQHTMIS